MDPIATLADRAALFSLKLLAALHVLFFLAFMAGLLAAGGRAHAETSACIGTGMTAMPCQGAPAA